MALTVVQTVVDSTPPTRSTVCESMDRLLDLMVHYICVDRDSIVSHRRVMQAMENRQYTLKMKPYKLILTGSRFEGMPTYVCNDGDVMHTSFMWPVVIADPSKVPNGPGHQYLIPQTNTANPAFVTLKVPPTVRFTDKFKETLVDAPGNDGNHEGIGNDGNHDLSGNHGNNDKQYDNANPGNDGSHDGNGDDGNHDDSGNHGNGGVHDDSENHGSGCEVCDSEDHGNHGDNGSHGDGGNQCDSGDHGNSSNHDVSSDNWRCVSTERFVSGRISENTEIHGPAGTGMVDHRYEHLGMMDTVPCLTCPHWPPIAEGYFTRLRVNGWPPWGLLGRLRGEGCLVVGVGHPLTVHRDTEWRWSFSVAERELIHHMSGDMAACMYVLKAVKNTHGMADDPDKPTMFCSYFIKTACLWLHEVIPLDTVSVTYLCRTVIDWLLKCYRCHNMPHYFIPEQNLIGQLEPSLCGEVVSWLEGIQADLWRVILTSVELDRLLIHLINNAMCTPLKLPHVSTGSDFKLLTSMFSHCDGDRAAVCMKVLDGMIDRLDKGEVNHWRWQRGKVGMSSQEMFTTLYSTIHQYYISPDTVPDTQVAGIPESFVLPLIDNIHTVVKEGLEDMNRQILYRFLGELCHCVLAHFTYTNTQVSEEFTTQPLRYYALGLVVVHPCGWSDKGLGGYVRLAKHYYLQGDWVSLGSVMDMLEGLLEEGRSARVINCLAIMWIHPDLYLCLCTWLACVGEPFYQQYLATCSGHKVVWIHPVSLGYYLQARLALRNQDHEKAVKAARCLGEIVDLIGNDAAKESTHAFISVLAKELDMSSESLVKKQKVNTFWVTY